MKKSKHLTLFFAQLFVTSTLLVNTVLASPDLVVSRNKLWMNFNSQQPYELNIAFLSGTAEQKRLIQKFASIWTRYANLNFNFYQNLYDVPSGEKAHIKILIGSRESNAVIAGDSTVGTDANYKRGSQHTMRIFIKDNEMAHQLQGIVLHEFGHAIGLQHEHQHPDREIIYDEEKTLENCRTQNIPEKQCRAMHLSTFSRADHDLYTYDAKSIMHYALHANIVKQAPEAAFVGSSTLSLLDKIGIAKVYPGRKTEEEIRAEHEVEMIKIEQTRRVGECDITSFRGSYSGSSQIQTFYSYQSTEKSYRLGFGIPSKENIIVSMENDPRCQPVESIMESPQPSHEKSFLSSSNCRILEPGFRSDNPYISVYTISMERYVISNMDASVNLFGSGFLTKEDAIKAAESMEACY